MTKPLESLARIFHFSNKFLPMVTEPFSGDDWFHWPGEGGNHAYWIVAHLAAARRSILRNIGETIPKEPWEESFGRGSKPDEKRDGPTPEELISDFQKSGDLLCARLSAMTEDDVQCPYGRKLPDGSEIILDAMHFLYFHEAQHLGQIGLLRRILGKPGYI